MIVKWLQLRAALWRHEQAKRRLRQALANVGYQVAEEHVTAVSRRMRKAHDLGYRGKEAADYAMDEGP